MHGATLVMNIYLFYLLHEEVEAPECSSELRGRGGDCDGSNQKPERAALHNEEREEVNCSLQGAGSINSCRSRSGVVTLY
jgi:hypothetical protein